MEQSVSALRHAAKGIEVGDFAIEFRGDKLVMFRRSSGDHFTLHAGHNSGVIDLHRTWKDAAGRQRHETVFAMRRDRIPHLLGHLNTLPSDLIQLMRPLRLGWLGHRHITIVWGALPIDQEHIGKITARKARRKRVILDPVAFQQEVYIPQYLEEVWDMPDGPFSLWKRGRMIGFGMKLSHHDNRANLYWVKMRDLMRLGTKMQRLLLALVPGYAIPADEYHKYDVLRPKRN
jgi:hypothetical protein